MESATARACVRACGLGRVAIRNGAAPLGETLMTSVQVEQIAQRVCETFTLRRPRVLLQTNRRFVEEFRHDATRECFDRVGVLGRKVGKTPGVSFDFCDAGV